MSNWIENLKEYDYVFVSQKYGQPNILRKVARTTKTLVILTNGSKYSKTTGRLLGAGTWSVDYLVEPTEKEWESFRIRSLQEQVKRLISNITLPNDIESLRAFEEILQKYQTTEK